jgi:hypothetical protein
MAGVIIQLRQWFPVVGPIDRAGIKRSVQTAVSTCSRAARDCAHLGIAEEIAPRPNPRDG